MTDSSNANAATTPLSGNQALTPLPGSEKVFGWAQHASLWFSLGVGLLVIQIGAYLAPAVGTQQALFAIMVGSLAGSGLLAWVAKIGCDNGLSGAGLIHNTYGRQFARLPVLLNIVQLVGWTTFELVIMRDGTLAIAAQAAGRDLSGTFAVLLSTLIWGAILCTLLAGSMIKLVRKVISRYALPLVVLSLLWLSWQFLGRLNSPQLHVLWSRPGDGSMGMFSALDLVIAMPVSWLPLVADYARHGRSGRGALGGTWLGYALANIWCYALGVIVVSVAEPGADMIATLLLAQGGLIALGLILIDELDNAYGDIYSGSVSAHSIKPRWSIRRWALVLAISSTGLAMMLPMHSLEPFLLLLSSVFVPLYGVILGRLGLGGTATSASISVDTIAACLWVAGIAVYHGLALWAPALGSALPTLAFTFTLAALSRPRPNGLAQQHG